MDGVWLGRRTGKALCAGGWGGTALTEGTRRLDCIVRPENSYHRTTQSLSALATQIFRWSPAGLYCTELATPGGGAHGDSDGEAALTDRLNDGEQRSPRGIIRSASSSGESADGSTPTHPLLGALLALGGLTRCRPCSAKIAH